MKITGIVIARNEWPLLGTAILSLREQGIDGFIVVVSGSTDGSGEGVRRLQAHGVPIEMLEEPDGVFHQAPMMNTLMHAAFESGADWVIPFDADEFPLTRSKGDLVRAVIERWSQRHPEGTPMRVEVENYVVPADTDKFIARTLTTVRHRAVPTEPDDDAGRLGEHVAAGTLPFVCVPFPSKVFFPRSKTSWMTAGAHDALEAAIEPVPCGDIIIAHLPFPDRKRFANRSVYGQQLKRDGYSPRHAWQSQLIAEAGSDSVPSLESWWELNTSPETGEASSSRFERDDLLAVWAERIWPQLSLLDSAPPTGLYQLDLDSARTFRAAGIAGRQIELAFEREVERKQHLLEVLEQERSVWAATRIECDAAYATIAELTTEIDACRSALDEAQRRLDAISASRAWRFTTRIMRSVGRTPPTT